MAAYHLYNGTQNETNVIKLAGVLLSRPDVLGFLAGGAVDAQLVLCAVLFEATPAGLAAFAGQGKPEEALLGSLLGDTALMRDMLLAGGAKNGMYGQVTSRQSDCCLSGTFQCPACQVYTAACAVLLHGH